MPYAQLYTHFVFHTRKSRPFLTDEVLELVTRHLRGITERLGITLYKVGGVENHIHILVSLPSDLSVAQAAQKLKANTSRMLNKTIEFTPRFEWKKSYGAFSISPSHKPVLIRYIERQKQHHRRTTPDTEFNTLLTKYKLNPPESPPQEGTAPSSPRRESRD